MRVGITLPQFTKDATRPLQVARLVEEAGLDGAFVFDHLWPIGHPDKPALHGLTLVGALAAETDHITLGSLVARVGLVPDAVLVHTFMTLHRLVGDRLVAGLGIGDSLSHGENQAFGVPAEPWDVRIERLGRCCDDLRAAGVRTWVGGHSESTRRVAAEHADGWNSWGVDLDTFAIEAADVSRRRDGEGRLHRPRRPERPPRPVEPAEAARLTRPMTSAELTWGGQVLAGCTSAEAQAKLDRHRFQPGLVYGTIADLTTHLRSLARIGVAWAIYSPLDISTDPESAIEVVAKAAAALR
jgi:alkanesulfonate monooxygenase SsuD/methylene tetrahydromethanopterin reductase-like flavin-dependent oxidoreductase (luciferase family)